jgi:2-methylene-furan-3-one reductase
MLSGRLSMVLKPPSLPYIPGKDLCGVVEAAGPNCSSKFKPGDVVVASRDWLCSGALAEYVVVQENMACLKPPSISPVEAAACCDSAVTALGALNLAKLKGGERVLILGGSGGVGSFLVQGAAKAGASFVAATSTQQKMVTSLGAHTVIDYTKSNWWELPELSAAPFDCIFDCVGGNDHYWKARAVLKSRWHGGRFVAVVADDPDPLVQNPWQLLRFALRMLWKPLVTPWRPWLPAYILVVSSVTGSALQQVLARVASGEWRVALDPASPLPFTQQGVAQALAIQASHHAHGKVVVKVADE